MNLAQVAWLAFAVVGAVAAIAASFPRYHSRIGASAVQAARAEGFRAGFDHGLVTAVLACAGCGPACPCARYDRSEIGKMREGRPS